MLLKELVYLAVFVGVVTLALYTKPDSKHPDRTLLDYLRNPPPTHFEPVCLTLAFVSFALARVLLAPAYRVLIRDFYPPPPWRVISAVSWLSQMGKYVPGKIFTVAGFAWMMRRFGIPVSFGLTAVVLLTGVFVLLGVVLSVPLMFLEPLASLVPMGWLWCVLLLAAGLACLHPRILGGVANFMLRLLRRPPILVSHRKASYVQLMLNCLGQWLFVGLSMYFMLKSISDVPIGIKTFGVIVAASALSTTLGILVFFLPAGLGVREAVLLAALQSVIPGLSVDVLLMAILGTRVIQTLVEFFMAAVGYVILRTRKTRAMEVIS
jgi:hypothetical protein